MRVLARFKQAAIVAMVGGVMMGATACPPAGGPCDPAVSRCLRYPIAPGGVPVPYGDGSAVDISNSGEVIGMGRSDPWGAFRVPVSGGVRYLPPFHPGGALIVAAVNSAGTIAGTAAVVQFRPDHPVVWDAQDRLTDLTPKLPTFDGEIWWGNATDINDAGQVVGGYTVWRAGVYFSLAFVWDPRTDTVTVLNPEAVQSPAPSLPPVWQVFIGEGGIIAGYHGDIFSGTAARWWPEAGGGYRRESLTGGRPAAINAHGEVAGSSNTSALYWPADSSDAVPLPVPTGWQGRALAQDINDAGVIVGTHPGSTRLGEQALWWPDRANQPPAILGGGPAMANAVNRSGAVAGAAVISAPIGVPSGFVLRPAVWDAPAG
jgi:uncharacterized membrane protein